MQLKRAHKHSFLTADNGKLRLLLRLGFELAVALDRPIARLATSRCGDAGDQVADAFVLSPAVAPHALLAHELNEQIVDAL